MSVPIQGCMVFYLPPEIPLSEQTFTNIRRGELQFKSKSFSLISLYRSLDILFSRYNDEIAAGGTPDSENYKWNLYREIGIPENSIMALINSYPLPFGVIDLPQGIKHIFKIFNNDYTFQDAFINRAKGGNFEFLNVSAGYQIPFQIIVKGIGATENVRVFSLTRGEPEGYKIHLTPKPDYAFYTLLRLLTCMKNNEIFHGKKIMAKITLHFRDNLPGEVNTEMIKLNGGGVPSIVLYSNQDNSSTKAILDTLLSEFKNDVARIGAMTPDYKYRILPFNVRLNSLISYAQGDRLLKLDNRSEVANQIASSKKYFMPDWIAEIIRISNETRANRKIQRDLSTMSLQLLGKDITQPDLQAALSDTRCIDDICWMTANPSTMLDPRTLTNLQIEQASSGAEEADTTADNVVVHAEEPSEANFPYPNLPASPLPNSGNDSGVDEADNLPPFPPLSQGGQRKRNHKKTKKQRKGKKKGLSRRNKVVLEHL